MIFHFFRKISSLLLLLLFWQLPAQAHFLGGTSLKTLNIQELNALLDVSKTLDSDASTCIDWGTKLEKLQPRKPKLYVYANGDSWFDSRFASIELQGLDLQKTAVAEMVRIHKKVYVFTLNPILEKQDLRSISERIMKFEMEGARIAKISVIDLKRTQNLINVDSPQDIVADPNYKPKEAKWIWNLDEFNETKICQTKNIYLK